MGLLIGRRPNKLFITRTKVQAIAFNTVCEARGSAGESTLAKLNTSNGNDKPVTVILEDFNTGKNLNKNWWIGSPATYSSSIEDGVLKMKCSDVKEYQAFGKTFWEGEPLDINKTPYLKLRVKMQGDKKVKLRVNIRDQFDATNNKNSPFKYLYESKEFQDIYIDVSSSTQQEWPSAMDLKLNKIREVIFFVNPEGPAFTGTIYIDEVTLVNQIPQN